MSRKVLGAMELGLTGLGVVWLVAFSWSGNGIGLLLVWNLLAVAYMAAGWALLYRDLPSDPSADLDDWVGPNWYATTMALVASGSGAAAGFVMIAAREDGGGPGAGGGAPAPGVLCRRRRWRPSSTRRWRRCTARSTAARTRSRAPPTPSTSACSTGT